MTALAYILWVFAGERLVYFFVVNGGLNAWIDKQDDPTRTTPLVGSFLWNLWNVVTVVALILGGVVVWNT